MSRSVRWVLVLLLVGLLGALVSGRALFYRQSYLWLLLLLGSWAWTRISLRGVRLERTARRRRAQMGDFFEERVEIVNTGRLPRLWVAVQDESDLPGSRVSRVITLIGARESRSYLVRTRLFRRGAFTLGPTTLVSGDPFGLFTREVTFPPQARLLVYPRLVPVSDFPSQVGVLPGGEALRRRTSQVTPNAAGVREYAPGDPLKRIHWPSTARRGRFIVKEFELDPQAEVWLFPDLYRAVQVARPDEDPLAWLPFWRIPGGVPLPRDTAEYAICIAASLARYFLRLRRAVGLAVVGDHLTVLPPDRGGRQLNKVLETLALVRVGEEPIGALLRAQAPALARGSTVVVITPERSETLFLSLDMLRRRSLNPVLVWLDAASFREEGARTDPPPCRDVPCRVIRMGDDLSRALAG